MKDEIRLWLAYAQENLASARVLLESGLFNPCLQNTQQAVEKSLKACLIEQGQAIRKTHSINELTAMLWQRFIVIVALAKRSAISSIRFTYRPPATMTPAFFNFSAETLCKSNFLTQRLLRHLAVEHQTTICLPARIAGLIASGKPLRGVERYAQGNSSK